jgi:GT2 family glycosyltransferase
MKIADIDMDKPGPQSIAIVTIDIENLRHHISGLESYSKALLIFRYRQAIVGQAYCPVYHGTISIQDINARMGNVSWPAWCELMRSRVDHPLPTATIAVCTRDRTDDLAKCLESLLPLAEQGYEVLIVDNCPSDRSTFELVGCYPQVRYINEPKPGLNNARNRALREADGEVVIFTDDDAFVEPGWVPGLLENFEDPMVAIVTGITLPAELNTKAQCWFEETNGFGRGFVREVFDTNTIWPLASGKVGAGVNMAIRRSAVEEIGLFDAALDGGTATKSGGDQEYFYRALSRGFRIVYDPRAIVWHKHRRDWESLRNTIYGYGVGVFAWWTSALINEGETTLYWRAPKWFLQYHVRNLIRAIFRRPQHHPLDLAWAEFRGALIGPVSYFKARKALGATHPNERDQLQFDRGVHKKLLDFDDSLEVST